MKKTTAQLLETLKNENSINNYFNINNDELINKSLSAYLNEILYEKDINKTKAIEKSNLNNIYAYEIFSGKKKPSRNKLLQLIFGMELDLISTQRLLRIAGLSELYPRNKRDSVIIFAINNRLSLLECEEMLEELQEEGIQAL